MKIALLTNDAREIAGGAFFSQKLLIEALIDAGHQSMMIATKKRGGEKTYRFDTLYLETKYGDFGRVYQLYKLVKSQQIDVLMASMKPQLILLGILSFFISRKKIKLFGICRMGDHYLSLGKSIKNLPLRWLLGKLFSRLDGLIAISEFTSCDVQKTYFLHNAPTVIYNPFDVEEIRKKSNEFDPKFTKKTVVNVGRLVKQKAQHHLVELARELKKTRDDFEIVIVGQDGSCKESLKKLIKTHSLEQFVTLAGFYANPFPYIKHADLFVLTSLHEGFGRVVAESMALDTPVVAFRSAGGGHIELLEKNRGFLVPEGDIKTLADVVSSVLDSKEKARDEVANARKFVESLTPKSRAKEIMRAIEAL